MTYNIQGWLSSKSAVKSGTNLFSMNLLYYNSTRATNKYTGNISEWQWTQGSDSQNSYAFTYDKLDRVTNSNRYVGGISQNAFTEKNITYDRNGNITQLQRYGSNGTTLQDNFTYNYNGSTHNGNRLSSISGSVSATYSYDNNGNMTTDGRKNLQISYNVLNLQQRLMQGGTTMADYTYLSDGTKCGVVDNINNGYDYLGSLVYSRSGSTRTFESAVFGGGRIVYSSGAYSPYYYTTDHLGSTRVITNNSGTVVERNDYYPFGGKHSNASYPQLTVNRQKFNGKELQTTGNTGFLDYGARMYDDVIGRWGVVDPDAESCFENSSYAYVRNNPILRIDPTGKWDVTVHLYNDRAKYGYGIAIVTDRKGNEIYRFDVRGEGTGGRNRMNDKADTPLGVYDIPNKNMWQTGGSRKSYGPNARLIMKSFLIYLISTIVFSTSLNGQIKFWEDLSCSRKTDILRACQSEEVKKLYNGDFILSDDEKTEKLLNELVTSNDAILPLSFYLFNKIIVESDGALSEMVGEYCIEFLARHPRYILTYFTKERELSIKKPLWRIYAQFVGYELYFKKKGTSDLKYNYPSYKELLIASSSGKNGNEETLKFFWQLVDETMKNMN